jgi:imidazolonepropionase-like amidohydrolase
LKIFKYELISASAPVQSGLSQSVRLYQSLLLFALLFAVPSANAQTTVFRNVTIIDGTGAAPRHHASLVVNGDKIRAVLDSVNDQVQLPANTTVIDLAGKTIMPQLINCHAHLGLLRGTQMSAANYTKDNITRQLRQYQDYGVAAVQVMGTDHDEAYQWRTESRQGTLPGARIYTAGRGFGVPDGMPPFAMGISEVYRPTTPGEARVNVQELATHKPDLVKIWVDDFYGQYPKMKPEIYAAIIDEAHKHHLRVAAHVFYLEDAQQLVDAGIDILAHSVRDHEIPDTLIAEMKRRHVSYIGTLALDDFATAYENDPRWLNQPFFRNALEPGVYEMITSAKYKQTLKADKKYAIERAALPIALRNLKKVYDAGIPVALGTDSGAAPVRPFGFAEHRELQLLVEAGLTPLQAITVATRNSAQLLQASAEFGTLTPGLLANFIILDKDPSQDIHNTESIVSVWSKGKKVSDGPHPAL